MQSDDDAPLESAPIHPSQTVDDVPSPPRADGDPVRSDEIYPTHPDMVHLYEVKWTESNGEVVRWLSVAGIQDKADWHDSWREAGILPGTMVKLGFDFFPKQDVSTTLLHSCFATDPYPLDAKASRTYTLRGSWTKLDGLAPDFGWEVRVMGEEETAGYMYEDTVAMLHFYMPRADRGTLITTPSKPVTFSWYEQDGMKRSYRQWRYEEPSQLKSTP